jgi:isoleucyl-tRNA synthetase
VRRSAQSALYLMADGLTRLMAPILSFTADELWQFLPGRREESVHMAVFPAAGALEPLVDRDLLDRWARLIAIREDVLANIEPMRKDKRIGSSLQAKVVLTATEAELAFLEPYAGDLPMLFIVSEVELRPAPTDVEAHQEAKPRVTIDRASGVKCQRCWRYVPSVSTEPATAGLCERCQQALSAERETLRSSAG